MRKLLILLLLPAAALAQGADFMDGVRPFVRFVEDAAIGSPGYGEGQLHYQSWDNASAIVIGAQGGYLVSPKIEAGARLGFASWSFDDVGGIEVDGESGLLDIDAYGKYVISEGPSTRIVAGGLLSLPVGKEEFITEKTFDIEAFGAIRYAMPKMVITGNFGLRINGGKDVETAFGSGEVDGELSFLFGGGILYPVNEMMTVTGELAFESSRLDGGESFMQLTPGIDYAMASGLKLRGALGLGLDDAAPDFELIAGVAKSF